MNVTVLRISHRAGRDPRISTHCALVARAFGSEGMIYSGERDSEMEKTVNDITRNWGGSFKIRYEKSWRKVVRNFNGLIVHLTMYGMPLEEKAKEIGKRKTKRLLVIIGGEKVPSEVYHVADHNIAVTSQPHSEVSALAVFLSALLEGKLSGTRFENAKIRIVPQERGKKTVLDKA